MWSFFLLVLVEKVLKCRKTSLKKPKILIIYLNLHGIETHYQQVKHDLRYSKKINPKNHQNVGMA